MRRGVNRWSLSLYCMSVGMWAVRHVWTALLVVLRTSYDYPGHCEMGIQIP